MKRINQAELIKALVANQGNIAAAARAIGFSRQSVYYQIRSRESLRQLLRETRYVKTKSRVCPRCGGTGYVR